MQINGAGNGLIKATCGSAVDVTTLNNLVYQREIRISKNGNTYTVDVTVSWRVSSAVVDRLTISRQITNY